MNATGRLGAELSCSLLLIGAAGASAQTGFVNWESPHVSPLALTPSGGTLLAVNTADNRLEVFDLTSDTPVRVRSIPVGLDPVSVRARTEAEAWVVNMISDSVSVVDLTSGRVLRTLATGDAPADVVFAGSPQRAFVSCAKANAVMVFDPANPGTAPTTLAIAADEPRALAASPDGSTVYAAVFFSGNKTTILPPPVVSNPAGPYAGQNPPPNLFSNFEPPIAPGLAAPPGVALIVKQDAATGVWTDDNLGNWSSFVPWTLADRDVALINANNPVAGVTFANGLMNINAAIAVRPDGLVTTVGTDATNHVRFEDNINATFVRVDLATFDPASPNTTRAVSDLNPHLGYTSSSTTQAVREQSIGDPRAIAWNAAGSAAFVAGMGSDNVAVVSPSGSRFGLINVGPGPTGLALRESRSRLYVLNRFEGTVSEIDTVSGVELGRTGFYDPTPTPIKIGRPLLYNTHMTSGLGQASCASCHVDSRMDGLAWDLGSPVGAMKNVNQPCRQGPGNCAPWHPMKGPMVTQSLQGIVGQGAMHWRGDKEDVTAFNVAYQNLQGSSLRTPQEMQRLEAFVASIVYPPNPNRNFDNSLRTALPVTGGNGNAQNGLNLYTTVPLFGPPGPGGLTCIACHSLPSGTDQRIDSPGGPVVIQSLKDVQLRGMEEKVGFNRGQPNSIRGFGYNHDGTADNLFNLFGGPPFNFAPTATGVQQRRDMEAFFLSLTTDTPAAVGRQITLDGVNNNLPQAVTLIAQMIALADINQVGLIVKGVQGGIERGYAYMGGNNFQSDRLTEVVTADALRNSASLGGELTYTVVPIGTQIRMGLDRDNDAYFDRDELDRGSDPADPLSLPPPPPGVCFGNSNADNAVNFGDITSVFANWNANYLPLPGTGPGDANADGRVNFFDITAIFANWGAVCP